jgi:serine protease Do
MPEAPAIALRAESRPAARPGATRLSRMTVVLTVLAAAIVGPYVVGQFVYQVSYNKLQAGYDVATSGLAKLKPRLNDLEMASRLVAKRVEPSVVSIFRPGGRGREGQGSGVIVDQQGYVVTNYHVVNGAEAIHVQLSDGRGTAASVVGGDAMTDLAVLKIDLPNLIAAEWGDSDVLQVGDLVWAVGSPYGLDQSLTFGVVSAKARRSGSNLTHNAYQEYLQTDAAVNPGNSGGPLVNIEGQVVGINAAIFGDAYQGISFAIPSTLAREKYEELRTKGWVDRAWLGIAPREVPDAVRERLGLELGEGVYVGRVQSGAPADRAGIRHGDIILKWNDHLATDPTLLSRAIAGTEIGSTAKVALARVDESAGADIQRLELDVHVERAPWSVPTVAQ